MAQCFDDDDHRLDSCGGGFRGRASGYVSSRARRAATLDQIATAIAVLDAERGRYPRIFSMVRDSDVSYRAGNLDAVDRHVADRLIATLRSGVVVQASSESTYLQGAAQISPSFAVDELREAHAATRVASTKQRIIFTMPASK